MGFVWAAVFGALLGLQEKFSPLRIGNDIYIFSFAVMDELGDNYLLRMAGVYMISINSLLLRMKIIPCWIIILTYILASGFLFFADRLLLARYFFPAWVLSISIYILILNYRCTQLQGDNRPESKEG
jgi:hypothetical protein